MEGDQQRYFIQFKRNDLEFERMWRRYLRKIKNTGAKCAKNVQRPTFFSAILRLVVASSAFPSMYTCSYTIWWPGSGVFSLSVVSRRNK